MTPEELINEALRRYRNLSPRKKIQAMEKNILACLEEIAELRARLALVARMRACQEWYFQTRNRATLIESKKLEKEVDAILMSMEPTERG